MFSFWSTAAAAAFKNESGAHWGNRRNIQACNAACCRFLSILLNNSCYFLLVFGHGFYMCLSTRFRHTTGLIYRTVTILLHIKMQMQTAQEQITFNWNWKPCRMRTQIIVMCNKLNSFVSDSLFLLLPKSHSIELHSICIWLLCGKLISQYSINKFWINSIKIKICFFFRRMEFSTRKNIYFYSRIKIYNIAKWRIKK